VFGKSPKTAPRAEGYHLIITYRFDGSSTRFRYSAATRNAPRSSTRPPVTSSQALSGGIGSPFTFTSMRPDRRPWSPGPHRLHTAREEEGTGSEEDDRAAGRHVRVVGDSQSPGE